MEFKILHRRALSAARKLFTAEIELLDLLAAIESCAGFWSSGYTSLHVYCTDGLGLSDDIAYRLVRVARKCQEVPGLRTALAAQRFTLSKAGVIVGVLTRENQAHWFALAETLTKRELEREVANENPESPGREHAREQGNGYVRLEFSIRTETHQLLQRSLELVAQKTGVSPSIADTLHFVLTKFVAKEDPVEKADRNESNFGPGTKNLTKNRHIVRARDRGRCQFGMPNGKICGERKWVDIHHIVPTSMGGSDEPENLITLCSAHHRIVHKAMQEGAPLH